MRELPEASVDAVVCDPPYGIDFQGEAWDGRAIRSNARGPDGRKLSANEAFQVWASIWATECRRVLKPGGHLAAFGAPRTAHRLASALEDAGLQLRDTLMWLYGQGMPKSRRLPHGQGTALKPAYEPIILARKPPAGTITDNHQTHGTGTLNIHACAPHTGEGHETVRWPANVLLGHHEACRDRGRCTARKGTPMTDPKEPARVPIEKKGGWQKPTAQPSAEARPQGLPRKPSGQQGGGSGDAGSDGGDGGSSSGGDGGTGGGSS